MLLRRLPLYAVLAVLAPAPAHSECKDPVPIDPEVVTRQMKLKAFGSAMQAGPVCHLQWQGGAAPSLTIYGPTSLAAMGKRFTSTRQAAGEYKAESPNGVEPVPGVTDGYMVYDPKTPNRRLFVGFQDEVYMIVSQDQIPLEVLAQAVRRR